MENSNARIASGVNVKAIWKKRLWRPFKYEAVFHILVKKEMQVGKQYVERSRKIFNKGLNFALPKLRQ